MRRSLLFACAAVPVVCLMAAACAGGRKLARTERNNITADVAVGSLDDELQLPDTVNVGSVPEVVEVTDLQGNMIVMNAVKDEESGEMVASEHLDEIVVVAKFKHVAERNGSVDLVFELSVPVELQQKMWQVRFTPQYHVLGDTLLADKIYITGERYRRIQDWEHLMYNNYLKKIIPASEADSIYARERQLQTFLARNAGISSHWEEKARSHYRKKLLERINVNMAAARRDVYNRFVVDPYPGEGVRLDTVIFDRDLGGIRYRYVQNIKTMPGLKRVDMVMNGEVYTNGRKLCNLAGTAPITFYISSVSSIADNTERYLKRIVHRDLHLSTSYNIEFRKGKWNIDPKFSLNGKELRSIRENIAQILENEDYVMDSILIAASGSPDGKIAVNEKVAGRRGDAIKEYVQEYVEFFRDSVKKEVWEINEDESYREEETENPFDVENIRVSSVPEDWETLYELIVKDTAVVRKGDILALWGIADMDAREEAMRRKEGFAYVKENLYPKLRRVQFDFKLHRKGMIKDTVHTTELDTVYMRGVEALQNRDYKLAVTLLRPYSCYNTAVAYVCMDYNKSALEILEGLPRDARRDYLLALVYSRLGDSRKAVQFFLNSVEQDESMRLRGNLDPEISELIKRYGIN